MSSAAATARQLVVKFVGTVDPSVEKSASRVAGSIGKTGSEGKTAGQKIRTAMTVASVAAAAAVVKFGKDAISAFKSAAGEVIPLKRNLGLTAEDASRLRYELKMSGVDVAAGSKGFVIFAKNLDKMATADDNAKAKAEASREAIQEKITALKAAGKNTTGYADKMADLRNKLEVAALMEKSSSSVLSQMGIQYRTASGDVKPMVELLPQLADKFSKMKDGPEKTATVMKLFGKSGAALLPFLNKGAAGLAELAKKSDLYGQTLSGSNLDALSKSKAAQRDWNTAVEGLQIQFGAQLLPLLTEGTTFLTSKLIPGIVGVTGFLQSNSDAVQMAVVVGGGLFALIKTVTTVTRAWSAVQAVLNVVMAANPIGIVVIAIAALVAGIIFAYNNCKEFRAVVDASFKAIAVIGKWLWNNALQPVIKAIVAGFAWVVDGVASFLDVLGNIPGFEWAKGAASSLRGVASAARGAADGIRQIPDEKRTAISATTSGSAEVQTLANKIASLKDKQVKAKAEGDASEVDSLQHKIDKLESKKVKITAKAALDEKAKNTWALKITNHGTVKLGLLANGGILGARGQHVKRFAGGGIENHVAQIAPAGAYRLWAEQETGGEGYVPLSPAKRGTSVPIWWEIGRRLGVVKFADGGIRGSAAVSNSDDLLAALRLLLARMLTRDDLQALIDALRQAPAGPRPAARLG